jgi:hypothetical protein
MLPDDQAKTLGQLVNDLLWDQPLVGDDYPPYIMFYADRDKFIQNHPEFFAGLSPEVMADFVEFAEKIIYNASLWNRTFGLPMSDKPYVVAENTGLEIDAYLGDGRAFHDKVYLLNPQFSPNDFSFQLNTPGDQTDYIDEISSRPRQIEQCSIVYITARMAPNNQPIVTGDNTLVIPFGTPFQLYAEGNNQLDLQSIVASGYITGVDTQNKSFTSMSISFMDQRLSLIRGEVHKS